MMKKTIKKSLFFFSIAAGLSLAACSDDDNNGVDPVEPPIEEEDSKLSGEIDEDRTLDADVEYTLTGTLTVLEGNTLTIPAGTRIVTETGTDVYIAVQMGAKIDIQGTEQAPVVMASKDGNAGDWGGLILLGRATTSEGVDVVAEVGGLIYGGTQDDDNSGSINYLILEGTGAQINPESQFNGLTLYAVGSGTTIQNVAILNGTDDGVEFFGGTVSASNFYLENLEDDAVDWTEGWNGTLTNTYVLHTRDFSTAIEADNVNNNPKIVNFTAVSEVGGTALQFKKESGATIEGLSLTGYDTTIDMRDNGPLANVIIEGEQADPEKTYSALPTVDVSIFDWVQDRGSVTSSILQGTVNEEVVLDASVEYHLNSSFIVEEGGKLVIPAGTKIIARDGGTDVYIAILRGAQIEINGTPDKPVIITSENSQPEDWGGLTIVGNAPTSEGIDVVAEVGGFIYGGTDPEDNSGVIKNLIIAGTGAQINSESQYNGVTFYSVGSGTVVENIAVYNGADDGIEFFGGTVSATNLYVEDLQDDAIDWTEGWNGTITNTYVLHTDANFSTAIEADGPNENPKVVNFTAINETNSGTALQFKKESGATITNLYLEGYETIIDMRDGGPLDNVQIDGEAADHSKAYNAGEKVDISEWTWRLRD